MSDRPDAKQSGQAPMQNNRDRPRCKTIGTGPDAKQSGQAPMQNLSGQAVSAESRSGFRLPIAVERLTNFGSWDFGLNRGTDNWTITYQTMGPRTRR